MDIDRLRLLVQGVLALGVLIGATVLGVRGTIGPEAVVAIYSAGLGAVGAGAVGGVRQLAAKHGSTEVHTESDGNGGTTTTVRPGA